MLRATLLTSTPHSVPSRARLGMQYCPLQHARWPQSTRRSRAALSERTPGPGHGSGGCGRADPGEVKRRCAMAEDGLQAVDGLGGARTVDPGKRARPGADCRCLLLARLPNSSYNTSTTHMQKVPLPHYLATFHSPSTVGVGPCSAS